MDKLLSGRRVLVVEDEMMVLMMIEDMLADLGCESVAAAATVDQARAMLGLTTNSDPVKIELDLNALLPPPEWGGFSLRTILHGRRVCIARRPRCDECVLVDLCPSARPTLPVTSSPAP